MSLFRIRKVSWFETIALRLSGVCLGILGEQRGGRPRRYGGLAYDCALSGSDCCSCRSWRRGMHMVRWASRLPAVLARFSAASVSKKR
jgi:hypothetical protein